MMGTTSGTAAGSRVRRWQKGGGAVTIALPSDGWTAVAIEEWDSGRGTGPVVGHDVFNGPKFIGYFAGETAKESIADAERHSAGLGQGREGTPPKTAREARKEGWGRSKESSHRGVPRATGSRRTAASHTGQPRKQPAPREPEKGNGGGLGWIVLGLAMLGGLAIAAQ